MCAAFIEPVRILITGRTGRLGRDFVPPASPDGDRGTIGWSDWLRLEYSH
ncbi:MAG TPA: hypothetical protein VF683_07950 [Chthoniobacterales bacterium]